MHNERRYRIRRATSATLASVLSVWTFLAGAARGQPGEPLEAFLDQLDAIESVRMRASVVIHTKMESFSTGGGGSYWYLEQGEMFRVGCRTDPHLGALGDIEYGYDGDASLIRMMPSNTLSENVSVDREAPTALRNPFFYPVTFLFDEETCLSCRTSVPKLQEARRHLTIESVSASRYLVRSSQFPQTYTVETEAVLGMEVPIEISWDSSSRGEMLMILSDYELIDGIVWSTAITTRGRSPRNEASSRASYLLTDLAFNAPLEKAEFRLIDADGEAQPLAVPGDRPW